MDITVSESVAKYFYEQCAGSFTGHMANVPNNPVLHGLLHAHSVSSKQDFSRFLHQVAEKLIKDQPF